MMLTAVRQEGYLIIRDGTCNQQLPQSALGSKTPLQAMKDWRTLKPELFRKQPYYLPGYDKYASIHPTIANEVARLYENGGAHF